MASMFSVSTKACSVHYACDPTPRDGEKNWMVMGIVSETMLWIERKVGDRMIGLHVTHNVPIGQAGLYFAEGWDDDIVPAKRKRAIEAKLSELDVRIMVTALRG